MNTYLKLAAFDFRLYLRDGLTLFWILIYPILMLLIFGQIFGNQPGAIEGTRYIDSYVPALCVMNVLSVSVFTLQINMVTYRGSGILRRFRVTPVKKWNVLASHALQGVCLVLAGAAEILIVSKLVWNIDVTAAGIAQLLVSILFGCIGFFSLGFALSGLSNSPGAASGLAMIFFFPMLFLSGITMPLDIFPTFLQHVSEWIPMTYFVNLAQGVWLGGSIFSFGLEWAVLAGFAVLCLALAFLLFRWES
ncbi:ABC transporter permease [Cohnella nanjingensis]|uniref:Transport permease protein n=1 Tax=Cohnella nanjingensis TaxID=1387779 RepID=A0A7X0VG41_9BACL|nr:ABC transporter permease [Cohnella nanjingensis]MBB6672730.1 ABC transporter permease [Cohnella nanjingensis]